MSPIIYTDLGTFYSKPQIVKIGGKVIYRGKDASDWLTKQKDRNIKSCAKLCWQ